MEYVIHQVMGPPVSGSSPTTKKKMSGGSGDLDAVKQLEEPVSTKGGENRN